MRGTKREKPLKRRHNKGPTAFTPQKKEQFLRLLRATGNVGKSADGVGMTREAVYGHRNPKNSWFDQEFRERWDDAYESYLDDLEEEGFKRAMGEKVPVLTGAGKAVMIRDPVTKKMVPLTKKRASDLLMIFMLKGNRVKYRDQLALTGGDGGPVQVEAKAAKEALISKLFKRNT